MKNHHLVIIISTILALAIIASGVFYLIKGDKDASNPNTTLTDTNQSQPKDSDSQTATKTGQLENYYVAIGDNGQSGTLIACQDSLVKVDTPSITYTNKAKATFTQQLEDHNQYYGQSGLYNPLYLSRLNYQSYITNDNKVTINLKGDLKLAGDCDGARVRAQLERVAKSSIDKDNITIKINNTDISDISSLKGE